MVQHPFHPPSVPSSRWRLKFCADSSEALEEYLEQVCTWAEEIIERWTIVEKPSEKPKLIIVLDILGADAQSIIELFRREKESWQEIQLLSQERDHDNDNKNN